MTNTKLTLILYFSVLLQPLSLGSHPTDAQDLNCKPLAGKTNEIPPDGTYCLDIAYYEWQGKSLGEKLVVVVKGKYVKIIYLGGTKLSYTQPGDIIDEGPLLKHKSGKWIISSEEGDAELDQVGGCGNGPSVIDFKTKKWWTC